MAVALSARNLAKTFGTRSLFRDVSLSIVEGERLGMIGPNGAGKSTFLKILAGMETTDKGEIVVRRGLRVAYVPQSDEFAETDSVEQAVMRYMLESGRAGVHDEHEALLQAQLLLDRLGFSNLEQLTSTLSGGQRKRLAIGCRLAGEPDLLLLDEPTNHLDLEGVEWLEELLAQAPFASVFITHDRFFLESTATRIVELSRSYPEGTFSVEGDYSEFLRRKQEFLDGQQRQQQSLANQVREDLRWLSRGAQARRTKSKSRAAAAHERIDELATLRERNTAHKAAGIEFASSGRQTNKLLEARWITKSLGSRPLFTDLSLVLSPGRKVGLLGPNGSGKTTLIKVLIGELEPDPPTAAALEDAVSNPMPPSAPPPGGIARADRLRVVLFSQHRTELDPAMTLCDALCPHSDSVVYNGRVLHVNTWAQKFLFTAEQLKAPVRSLSGGERARVHIARLMLEPADVLILDEPTNDLDIPSLEVLEESLEEFPGAIVLVTHDRAMLARLATLIVALDGKGQAEIFVDFEQWQASHELAAEAAKKKPKPSPPPVDDSKKPTSSPTVQSTSPKPSKKKLTYNEQRELAGMEESILKAEAAVAETQAKLATPEVTGDHRRSQQFYKELSEQQARVETLYARWATLQEGS